MPVWPWETDSREDRARRVALSYRQLVELCIAGRIDCLPEALARLDAKWMELQQGWVRPTHAPLDPDDWLTPADLAELLHIEPRAPRDWHRRGHIRRLDSPLGFRYSVGDVIRYYAKIRSPQREKDCVAMTATLQYFTVTNSLYQGIETNTTSESGNAPTVIPISGTVAFTPVDAKGNAITQVVSAALDSTILLDPIQGRFSVDTDGGTPDGVLRALNGTAGLELVDNQNLGLTALYYYVQYSNVVFDGIGERLIAPFYFAAPGNGATIDLNTVAQLAL